MAIRYSTKNRGAAGSTSARACPGDRLREFRNNYRLYTARIRTIERSQTRRSNPQRSVKTLLLTFVASSAALAICGAALILGLTREVAIATGYGILAMACVSTIRCVALGPIGITAIAAPALGTEIAAVGSPPE